MEDENKSIVKKEELHTITIPERIRSFVYLVGMLGFPVVIATYVLVVLSEDIKNVDKSLNHLASSIDERPMSLDRSTDFIIYVCDSLQNELLSNLPALLDKIDFNASSDPDQLTKHLNRIDRQLERYVRPIVRKHMRFASRFPSVGGNLGSLFYLSAPAEDMSEGDSEAYLRGRSIKDFGESLNALMFNNIVIFGNPLIKKLSSSKSDKAEEAFMIFLEGDRMEANSTDQVSIDAINQASNFLLIKEDVFYELSVGAINTAVIGLRDQMLDQIKQQGSELNKN